MAQLALSGAVRLARVLPLVCVSPAPAVERLIAACRYAFIQQSVQTARPGITLYSGSPLPNKKEGGLRVSAVVYRMSRTSDMILPKRRIWRSLRVFL